jgi:pimeloyl-ACP methyl ester carboxylesterase
VTESTDPLSARSAIVVAPSAQIEVIGRGRGPTVVAIPSLGRGAEDWDRIACGLAVAGYRVLCPQPRGLGRSVGSWRNLTLHDLAQDVAAVIEAEDNGPAAIAGHAFGNFVARATAADFPHLVRGIAIMAAAHVWPLPADVRTSIEKSHDPTLPDAERLQHIQRAFFAPGNDPRPWLYGWNEGLMLAERAATDATPRDEWWSGGRVPLLDLQAEFDVTTPPDSRRRYRDELGEQRVEIALIENAGHALLPEQPEAVLAALIAFFRKIGHPACN